MYPSKPFTEHRRPVPTFFFATKPGQGTNGRTPTLIYEIWDVVWEASFEPDCYLPRRNTTQGRVRLQGGLFLEKAGRHACMHGHDEGKKPSLNQGKGAKKTGRKFHQPIFLPHF